MKRGWKIFWMIILAFIITNVIMVAIDDIVYNNIDLTEWLAMNGRMIIFGVVFALLWVISKLRKIGKG